MFSLLKPLSPYHFSVKHTLKLELVLAYRLLFDLIDMERFLQSLFPPNVTADRVTGCFIHAEEFEVVGKAGGRVRCFSCPGVEFFYLRQWGRALLQILQFSCRSWVISPVESMHTSNVTWLSSSYQLRVTSLN